jgi:hypothetical protein
MKFKYNQLIKRGFKRTNCNDSVFFEEYGFEYFLLQKKLNSYCYFDWDINTNKVFIIKHDKSHNITFKKEVISEFEYSLIEELLKNPNK